ncbi:hypothetical protein [Arthrobacter sp. efr-133-TYG-118]|uniref:hypothetical protein n=1 Tax=Arthrobacter sp. efr-133-TYG-118 TaxID=3040279 RepID=UPI0025515D67|nr:hypothetical protein [Arthrobacter sp. efr-133-TYG-118]
MTISTKHAKAIRAGVLQARKVLAEARMYKGDVIAVDPDGVEGYAFRRVLMRYAFEIGRYLTYEGKFVRLVPTRTWPRLPRR